MLIRPAGRVEVPEVLELPEVVEAVEEMEAVEVEELGVLDGIEELVLKLEVEVAVTSGPVALVESKVAVLFESVESELPERS